VSRKNLSNPPTITFVSSFDGKLRWRAFYNNLACLNIFCCAGISFFKRSNQSNIARLVEPLNNTSTYNSKGATFEFKFFVKVFTIESNILSKRIMQLDIDFRNLMIISNRNHKSFNSNMKIFIQKEKMFDKINNF